VRCRLIPIDWLEVSGSDVEVTMLVFGFSTRQDLGCGLGTVRESFG